MRRNKVNDANTALHRPHQARTPELAESPTCQINLDQTALPTRHHVTAHRIRRSIHRINAQRKENQPTSPSHKKQNTRNSANQPPEHNNPLSHRNFDETLKRQRDGPVTAQTLHCLTVSHKRRKTNKSFVNHHPNRTQRWPERGQ